MTEEPLLEELPEKFGEQLKQNHDDVLTQIKQNIFQNIPRTAKVEDSLMDLIANAMTRQRPTNRDSGVVIAGFGDQEYFPSLVEISMYGMVDGQLLFHKKRNASVGNDAGACIMAFAQQEMVHTFMSGIDPRLQETMQSSAVNLFEGVASAVMARIRRHDSDYAKALAKEIRPELEQTVQGLLQQWEQVRSDKFVSPVMGIINALPKDELAAMAESLVNLTKFKRRISEEEETVGGPIDVAIISKGDGFIWVQRKHYFEPELNPRFMAKYH